MRKVRDSMTLPCILTDEEKAKYSADLAQAVSDKKKHEGEMERFKSQNKAQITSCETTIDLCAELVNTGREYRSVECSIEYDFDNKTKKWIRIDTGEEVKHDIITESELQEEAQL